MPTERIGDVPFLPGWKEAVDETKECRHPDHNPPSMMVWRPGVYRHTYPNCGKQTEFTVQPTHHLTMKR